MNIVLEHWSFDPMLVVILATVLAHEVGLARLKLHSATSRVATRRRRSILFYLGLATLVIAIESPIDYWSSSYFYVHMLEHLLLAFFAPMLIVAGAPWVPMMFALPVSSRRSLGRFMFLSPKTRALRSFGRFARHPWTAVLSFNAVMVLWHVPALFDWSERNTVVHIWLMHASFIVTGILFWLQFIASHPMKPARGPVFQVTSLVATNLVMTVLAMSMSILTSVSWYASYAHVPHAVMSPFADQQIGAAILWVCGDFWALPWIYVIIRRSLEREGSFTGAFDRIMGRGAAPPIESFRKVAAARDDSSTVDLDD